MNQVFEHTGEAIAVENPDTARDKRPIRALVADDYPSMQQALVACVQSLAGIQVVGTAANGEEALKQSAILKPDLVVADLLMPIMNGFRLFTELRKIYPQIRLVAVSGHYSPAIEHEAISAGADAFVPKNGLPTDLVRVLEKLLQQ